MAALQMRSRVLLSALAIAVVVFSSWSDAASTTYSPALADYAIDFAAAAYCSDTQVQQWKCLTCKLHPQVTDITLLRNSQTDTQAFTAYDAQTGVIWLAFRGTDPLNIVNWLDDLDFFKTPYPGCSGCEVHRGFYHSYQDVAAPARAAVRALRAKYPDAPLYVTGHSLGAAEAEFAALDMAEQGITPAMAYTFGCPRVGGSKWYLYYAKMVPNGHFRITHFADPVPHLPLEIMGFHHTAREIWYNEFNTKYKVCDGSGEDPHCADSILVPLLITDHLTYMGLNLTENFLACRL